MELRRFNQTSNNWSCGR